MTKKYIFFNEGRNNVGHSFETAILSVDETVENTLVYLFGITRLP